MVEKRCALQREVVYHWFSQLSSAQRAEFLCGLLDLCVPIELRFLGSCLEDLARKDYHSLRDAEIKANNAADLASLTNITDEVVRSKLLVSLALLGSDNREAARALFRTLTHIDAVIHNYGLRLNEGRAGDQFLLLFTMAANHPAFSFHQKQVLRRELAQIQSVVHAACGEPHGGSHVAPDPLTLCSHKGMHREEKTGRPDEGRVQEAIPPSTHVCPELLMKVNPSKPAKATIDRIELKAATQKGEKPCDYAFEVLWSDSSVSIVSRTSQEVTEFLSLISQLFQEDELEKRLSLPTSLDFALPPDPRCLTNLPQHLLRLEQVQQFFSPVPQGSPDTGFGCVLQHRGASSPTRPMCGVASVQPVITAHCSLQSYSAASFPLNNALTVLPPSGAQIGECVPNTTMPNSSPQQQQHPSTEQNGIRDWLRKLRLHKYYPVFKQLTMEKFLALTEEDLNKYDLTQGAKKKLKTQLELQNREKSEKRYLLSQFPVSYTSVARVTPTSHVGPHGSSSAELRVEVETMSHPLPRDSSSSSGYSSSPSSPMGPREETFDRPKDFRRRAGSGSDSGERERSCVLLNHTVPTGPSRPTAQVLPVQNEPSSSPSAYHLPLPPPILPGLPAGRGLGAPRKPRLPSPCAVMSPHSTDERSKALESRFPGLSPDVPLQSPPPIPQEGLTLGHLSPPSLMVETSTTVTGTSNTQHHVSRPPLQPLLSPSIASTPQHRVRHCSSSASSSSWVSFLSVSSVPMATPPDSTYCVKSTSGALPISNLVSQAPPSCSPSPTEVGGASVCVCSSCGCSGSCGSYATLPGSYASYFQHPFSGPSVFTVGPLLHLSPLLTAPHGQSHPTTPYPYPLYSSNQTHEPQANMVAPPGQGYLPATPPEIVGNCGAEYKKTGNVSCYNCGVGGHWAQDCKHPPIDSTQQGTFRLKYSPPSDSQDSAD